MLLNSPKINLSIVASKLKIYYNLRYQLALQKMRQSYLIKINLIKIVAAYERRTAVNK